MADDTDDVWEFLQVGVMTQASELINKHRNGEVSDATVFYGLSALLAATRLYLDEEVVEALEEPLRALGRLPKETVVSIATDGNKLMTIFKNSFEDDYCIIRANIEATSDRKIIKGHEFLDDLSVFQGRVNKSTRWDFRADNHSTRVYDHD